MHDRIDYFRRDHVHPTYHHSQLTFGLMYALSENFVLALSHDEVVHGKGSLLRKMAGDRWQQLANLRALYGHMWAHPGKKLLFMGGELAQQSEWNPDGSLDWHLLEQPEHAGMQQLVRDLNLIYRDEPALWERDFDPSGFGWLEVGDAAANTLAFARYDASGTRALVCVENLSPVPRPGYRVGVPRGGIWREVLNTNAEVYGGSGLVTGEELKAEEREWHGQPWSVELTLPPLAVVWLRPE